MKIEPRHTFSIHLPTSLYQKVLDKAGRGKVSVFIKELLEKELLGGEQLKQQLILAHKRIAKNQNLKKELADWDETVDDYANKR